ncbi:hypothetical protein MIND_00529400 [Mycena indigotica]|uniref:Uncharacterized protein n=1 Tax=Mycena indigotica TaxID=2126181 RepID=A0A8H6SXV5_9AGAR|nr:uncharacterized protein MIND_00529400 [Mycena indigotica]KAF7307354.1 hypothetical protein MIND_00529400 [Mycena indigotica]
MSAAMDGVYSICTGLLLRVVVDAATFHNVKLYGTLIGLWEGIVVLHYVKKVPTSSDPYLALGVRLFVDFIVTASIFRLMIVLLWTTLGSVIADVAPAVWVGYGLKKRWSRLRRELYWTTRLLSRKRRTATVRFVTVPTIASGSASSDVSSVVGSTVVTTAAPLSTLATESIAPTSPATRSYPPTRLPNRRRRSSIPGTLPGSGWSETDTDGGSRVGFDRASTLSGSVFRSESGFVSESVFPSQASSHITISQFIPANPSEDSLTVSSSQTSRSSSPTYSLEYSDDPSASNPLEIPSDMEEDEEEEQVLVHVKSFPIIEETTPKQIPVVLPPTPSDTFRDWESSQEGEDMGEEVLEVPPSPWIPQIPDQELLDEWETVSVEEAEAPPVPPKDDAPEPSSPPQDDGSDATSVNAPSTIAPLPPLTSETSPPDATSSDSVPEAEVAGDITSSMPEPEPIVEPSPEVDPHPPTSDEPTDESEPTPVPPETNEEPPTESPPPPPTTDEPTRTPPPSFEDIYGEDLPKSSDAEPEPDAKPEVSEEAQPSTPSVPPSPAASVRHALSLRKEALELNARIASLGRKRKTSLSERTAESLSAAMLAKIEIDRAEKELAELNAKAEGAFVGAYNPPTASLYEFNTTGLTPEEAVRQTETRLGQLLLTPVPPAGTRPEDLAHDSPNRGALKVTMEQSIKGRLVKTQLLSALTENGMNWNEDTSRPNVIFVLIPVMAESESGDAPPEAVEGTTDGDKKDRIGEEEY